jgi:two-component system, response regulator PdtaR
MPPTIETVPATVLVVDDDALTLMTAIVTVEEAGYVVISAHDAEDAMRALLQHPEIAGLFTDINMPGVMDGLALAHETRRLRPAMQILLASGAVHPGASDMPARGQYLRKPYTPVEVVSCLHGLLG